ncbi:MAG TPA: IPT/TIG domain-containing protein [Coriobacteriia bacterium]
MLRSPSSTIRLPDRRAAAAVVCVALLAAVLLTPAAAHAVGIRYSVEELAGMSRSVVLADVVRVESRQLPPEPGALRGAIVTDVDLSVVSMLKGAASGLVRLTVPGGEVAGTRLAVSEAPVFAAGDRRVVFIGDDGHVIAGSQGSLGVLGSMVPALGLSVADIRARIDGTWSGIAASTYTRVLAAAEGATVQAAAAGPAISQITPPRQPAGTKATVTISGTGFGAAQGGGGVTFALDGAQRVAGTVVGWSDTQITCEVPADASSGSVVVTTADGLASPGVEYAVGFAYAGQRWSAPLMNYRVNPNSTRLAAATALSLVRTGADGWNSGSPFRFVYAGATAQVGYQQGGNGVNEVFWTTTGIPREIPAMSYLWYGWDDRLVEVDVAFNNGSQYAWGDGSPGTVDVASVALHEFGHALALADQYGPGDQEKVMFGVTMTGLRHRTPSADDVAGLRYIYGSGEPPAPAPTPTPTPTPGGVLSATSLSMFSNASSVRYPRPFVLSGVLAPGAQGDPVVVEVRKPGSARWSYSSARLVYAAAATGGGAWWYRYTPRLRGAYYFRARFAGSSDRLASVSRTIAVRVR